MTASIRTALIQAGLMYAPITRRIWQFLKDNGPHNANELAEALNLTPNLASSKASTLVDRCMVTCESDTDPIMGHSVLYYQVVPTMQTYKLLPISQAALDRIEAFRIKKASKTGVVKAGSTKFDAGHIRGLRNLGTAHLPTPVQVTQPQAAVAVPSATNDVSVRNLLDRLTTRQAYAIYLELRTMFAAPSKTSLKAGTNMNGSMGIGAGRGANTHLQ